jgi:hypothetical protein
LTSKLTTYTDLQARRLGYKTVQVQLIKDEAEYFPGGIDKELIVEDLQKVIEDK